MPWRNTVAFPRRRQFRLAAALAHHLATTKNEFATEARALLSDLRARGLAEGEERLVDPWRPRPFDILAHSAMAMAVPAILAALVLLTGNGASPAPTRAEASPPSNVIRQATPEGPRCAGVPSTGAALAGKPLRGEAGHSIDIMNGGLSPAIVKIRDAAGGGVVMAVFIREGDTGRIGPLADGVYRIRYALGTRSTADRLPFRNLEYAARFHDTEALETPLKDEKTVTPRLSYSLYSVPNADVRSEQIDRASFDAE